MTASIPSSALVLDRLIALDGERWGHGLTPQQCQRLIARYGSQSSGYFNLQEGVQRFGIEDVGFLAYFPMKTFMGRVNVVFANPVCAPSVRPWLLRAFLNRAKGRTFFVGIDDAVARDLRELGYNINEMGTEFSVPLADFDVRGKHKKQLRHAANLGERCGVVVKEQRWHEVNQSEVVRISEEWRRHKAVSSRELRLLTRPPVFDNEWAVRKFYCYEGERLLGYVFFDPFYKDGKIVGYTANILRQDLANTHSGLLDFVILEAMKQFRAEGIEWVSLGISPLHNVQQMAGDRPIIRKICQSLYEYGNKFYAFKALAYHKTRYRGEETKWYVATDDIPAFKVAWTILRATGILGQVRLGQTGGSIMAGLL